MDVHIGEICTRSVVTCRRDTSALELAQLMRERHVGAVVVVDEHEGRATPVGLVTDRDLVVEVMACGVDPAMLLAADLIVADPVIAVDTELVFDAIWHMRRKGIRRLPVVDAQGHLTGILTTDDVARFLAEQLTSVATIVPSQLQREEAKRSASLLGR
jgi:signal-transduction protein with cAMP-binding, CBS, and nucleotidyltransferase domain